MEFPPKFCSITEASEFLSYKSRAQHYRMKEEDWQDNYLQIIDCKTYLIMEGPREKPSLARHIMELLIGVVLIQSLVSIKGGTYMTKQSA